MICRPSNLIPYLLNQIIYICLQHIFMHGWRDLNSQPMVLETITLPIELHPYRFIQKLKMTEKTIYTTYYSIISVTLPAPTVLPPSRIAKRNPTSIAILLISLISKLTLSPGITISISLGSLTSPVTSVVLK